MAKRVKILVVDDDRHQRRLLRKTLKDAGYEVDTVEDGLKALILIDRSRPDILISDINMPDLDGLKLAKGVRFHPRAGALPIIFITSNDTPRNLAQSVNVQARSFLSKPVDLDLLLQKVEEILASRQPAGATRLAPSEPTRRSPRR